MLPGSPQYPPGSQLTVSEVWLFSALLSPTLYPESFQPSFCFPSPSFFSLYNLSHLGHTVFLPLVLSVHRYFSLLPLPSLPFLPTLIDQLSLDTARCLCLFSPTYYSKPSPPPYIGGPCLPFFIQ